MDPREIAQRLQEIEDRKLSNQIVILTRKLEEAQKEIQQMKESSGGGGGKGVSGRGPTGFDFRGMECTRA